MYKPVWHLSGTPYPVQIEALKRCHDKKYFGHWVEQGMGKSPLLVNDYIENFSDLNTIVLACPNSFKTEWTTIPGDWGIDSITTSMWPRDEFRHGTASRPHINIINFEAVRSSGYYAIRDLMDKAKCLFVMDESSAIKNFQSKTAKAALDLSKRAAGVRELNGTPLVQNVMDLFPQLKCLNELKGMNPYVFRNRFAVQGGYMGRQVVGIKNEEELHAIQERCTYRGLKKDWWTGAPAKIWPKLQLEMTSKQQKHYREMLQDFITMVERNEFSADMVLTQSSKLAQITSGLLIDGDKSVLIEPIEHNPKALASLDVYEAGTGKMVVVYFFKRMGEALYNFYQKKGLNPAYIKGGMKPEELVEQKSKFNNDSSCRLLVGQIGATAMGHTLLGQAGDDRCYKMFFHDLSYNRRDMSQVEDRVHRGAQDRDCLYFMPIMSSIDAAQFEANKKKADLAAAVVDAVRALRRPDTAV